MTAADEKKSAAGTLDAVREGGQALLMLVNQRVSELQGLLAGGDFMGAADCAQQVASKTSVLAFAQANLGGLGKTYVVRVTEIQVGMVCQGWGEVVEVEVMREECVGGDHEHVHVKVKFEGGQEEDFGDGQEFLVQRSPEQSTSS